MVCQPLLGSIFAALYNTRFVLPPPPSGVFHVKGEGMLGSVNYGFWYSLGCLMDGTPIFLAVRVSLRVALEEIKMPSYCVGGLDQPGVTKL